MSVTIVKPKPEMPVYRFDLQKVRMPKKEEGNTFSTSPRGKTEEKCFPSLEDDEKHL